MKEALHQAGGGQLPKDPRKTSQQASRVRDALGLGGHHLSTVLIEMLMFFRSSLPTLARVPVPPAWTTVTKIPVTQIWTSSRLPNRAEPIKA